MQDNVVTSPVKQGPATSHEFQAHFMGKIQKIEERIAAGKELRKKSPRIRLGTYKMSANRADPVSILEKQAETRLPELVPIRYARMLASPFAFLRGAASIMAADLGAGYHPTGIITQLCGDMHVANFGVFASAERNLVFGINDFDETIPGPFEWDLKRLVASIVAAGRFLGGSKTICEEGVVAAVRSYRKRMQEFARMGYLDLWYATIDEKDLLNAVSGTASKGALKIMEKARGRTHMQVLGKLTDIVDEKYRMRVDAPFIVRETHDISGRPIEEVLGMFLESYFKSLSDERKALLSRYRITDVVRKVVGVGSVGTRCWVVFMTGNHNEDPLFLQIKQAEPSVVEPYVPKSIYANQGHRVVIGQRLIQAAPDICLGWFEISGNDFYVRQMRDMKGGVEFDPATTRVENLDQYSALCGWALALAHAKAGDAAMLAGYVGGKSEELDEAMVRFAFAYADQTERDYDALVAAAKKGRIHVAGVAE
jgi:uncharacterized protein (DUF2252 family)